MKIYTQVQKFQSKSNVGIVLVGDKDQIYMMDNIQVNTQDEISSHLYGIKKALSFVKNNKPLYANNDIECHPNIKNEKENEFIQKLNKDEYINQFLVSKNIKAELVNSNTDFDKQMNLIAFHQIQFNKFNFQGKEY